MGVMKRCSHQRGFSLVELMIVVIIIGIISAIAYPSYMEYVRDTRRATAQADLMELAQWMERQYSANYDYRDSGGNPTLPFTESPRSGSSAFYDLSFSGSVTQTDYVLQAVPKAGSDQANDPCGTLTLNETGVRSASGGGSAACW